MSTKQKDIPKQFDVIVVGAGPAGTECARELSRRGRKVLLMERSQRIGEPNFSSAGTPKETIKEFDLPMNTIRGVWSKVLMQANDYRCLYDYKKTKGYVFDFKELKKFLARDAQDHGARIMVGTFAEAPIVEKGFVRGVKYGGIYGKGEVRAGVVVDASGPSGILATKLKLRRSFPSAPAVGIESIIEDKKIVRLLKKHRDILAFYLGKDYVSHGYGWIFPFGKDAFKVGCCVYRAADHGVTRSDYSDMMAVFQRFIERFPELRDLQITELHGGDIFVVGDMKRDYGDGFLAIGDAAFQINPLGGEGIRHGLRSGRMAAEVIDKAIRRNDFSETVLSEYDTDWRLYIGMKWKLDLKIAELMYGDLNDGQWKEATSFLSLLSPDDFFEIIFHYNYSRAIKFGRLMKLAKMLERVTLG
jgi:digeranylgeranylglycerophospholipid reductase